MPPSSSLASSSLMCHLETRLKKPLSADPESRSRSVFELKSTRPVGSNFVDGYAKALAADIFILRLWSNFSLFLDFVYPATVWHIAHSRRDRVALMDRTSGSWNFLALRSGRHPMAHAMHRPDLARQLLGGINGSRVNAGVASEFTHHLDRYAIHQGLAHKGVAHPVRAGFFKAARIKTGIGRTFGRLGEEAFEHRIDASGRQGASWVVG